jgi:hypothetical protein
MPTPVGVCGHSPKKRFKNSIENDDVMISRRPLMLAQNVFSAKTFHKHIHTYLSVAHTLIHNAQTKYSLAAAADFPTVSEFSIC